MELLKVYAENGFCRFDGCLKIRWLALNNSLGVAHTLRFLLDSFEYFGGGAWVFAHQLLPSRPAESEVR